VFDPLDNVRRCVLEFFRQNPDQSRKEAQKMLADLWAFYDIFVGFIDTVITKWMGQENPFADFNSKMIDIEKLTKDITRVFSR